MRYVLYAVETKTNRSFEQEVRDEAEYQKLKRELEREGYSRIMLSEQWSNLDEMMSTVDDEVL